ncbi:MAG: TonB family protein [Candidatus Limimorpha sp.]
MKKIFTAITLLILGTNVFAQTKAAEPVSGESLTKKILQNHLVYPEDALKAKKGGKITVYFDIDEKGQSSNFKVNDYFDEQCALEAIRLVRQIEWTPAMNNSRAVASKCEYTVNFSPKSYSKAEKKPRPKLPESDYPEQKNNKIYNTKELFIAPKPYFANPQVTMAAYLRSELIYPEQAKQFEIQGTVKLNFIIETDGKASNITVENSIGGGCDNEAIRLISDLLWIPGVKNDSIVRTRTSQEITFRIGDRNYIEGNAY